MADSEPRELLKQAVARAGKVRLALAELREQAFASAAAAATSSLPPPAAPGCPAVPCLPSNAMQSRTLAASLPADHSNLDSVGSPDDIYSGAGGSASASASASASGAFSVVRHALVPPREEFCVQTAGERQASPKTSRRGHGHGSTMQQQQQQQQQQQRTARDSHAGRQVQHPCAAAGAGGFEAVLAALRAEGLAQAPHQGDDVQLPGWAQPQEWDGGLRAKYGGGAAGDPEACLELGAAASRSASLGASSDGGAGNGQRQLPSANQRQRQQGRGHGPQAAPAAPRLPNFDPLAAERQLREKLEQVNAVKRSNEARLRAGAASVAADLPRVRQPGRAAPAPAVPHLPLASLSRPSSAVGSWQHSGRRSSRENETAPLCQEQQQRWRAGQLYGSPTRGLSTAREQALASQAAAGAVPVDGGTNLLPLARDEHGRAQAGDAMVSEAPAQPLTARKETRISLSDLLSAPSSDSCALGPTATAPLSAGAAGPAVTEPAAAQPGRSTYHGRLPSRSTFSVADAAVAVQHAAATQAHAGSAAGGGMEHQPAAAAAVTGLAAAGSAAATVLPGEAAAPPLQDTPRHGVAHSQAAKLSGGGAADVHVQRGLHGGMLRRMHGMLQSPPPTPLDDVATAGTAAGVQPAHDTCSSTSASPGQVSTASSDSPGHNAAASPVRRFPQLGEGGMLQQTPPAARTTAAALPPQQQPCAGSVGQQQRPGSACGRGGDAPAHLDRSSSSIGRKRANSEAGCSEGPASAKKHSPEVGARSLARSAVVQQVPPGAPGAAGAAQALPQHPERGPQAEMSSSADKLQNAAPQPCQKPQCGAQQATKPAALPPAAQPSLHSASPQSPGGADSPPRRDFRLVVPVVLAHSPPQQRRRDVPGPQPAGAPAARSSDEPVDSVQPGAVPATGAAAAAAVTAASDHIETVPARQRAAAKTSAAAAAAKHVQALEPAPSAVPAAAQCVASPEKELPSQSQWVASRSGSPLPQHQGPPAALAQRAQRARHDALQRQEQQQKQQQQQESGDQLRATSVLISSGVPESFEPTPSASPAQQQAQQEPLPTGRGTPPPDVAPVPLSAAAAATAAATAAAAPLAAAHTITPRRRAATLEPQAAQLRLQDHPQGKQLLAAASSLVAMPGAKLLQEFGQGCVVRKAWVRPNFKQGGSTRSIQLACGSGGRPEMLYGSGLFRKLLRFAVRRVVVNSAAWRPGDYLVLDTARGMLRLEPANAADHARWVLALNAAFLASGAPPAGSGSGSGGAGGEKRDRVGSCKREDVPVGQMVWSTAVLLG